MAGFQGPHANNHSVTDVMAYLADRRKNFPSKARTEARKAAELAQKHGEKKPADALEKQAEKLRKQLKRVESTIKRKREQQDEGDEMRDSGSDDDDKSEESAPEEASNRAAALAAVAAAEKKADVSRHCKYYSTGGTCGKKGKCRFVHDPEVRGKCYSGAAGERRSPDDPAASHFERQGAGGPDDSRVHPVSSREGNYESPRRCFGDQEEFRPGADTLPVDQQSLACATIVIAAAPSQERGTATSPAAALDDAAVQRTDKQAALPGLEAPAFWQYRSAKVGRPALEGRSLPIAGLPIADALAVGCTFCLGLLFHQHPTAPGDKEGAFNGCIASGLVDPTSSVGYARHVCFEANVQKVNWMGEEELIGTSDQVFFDIGRINSGEGMSARLRMCILASLKQSVGQTRFHGSIDITTASYSLICFVLKPLIDT